MNDRIIAKDRYKKVERKNVEKKKNKISNMYNINGNLKKVRKKESIFSLTIVKIFLAVLAILVLSIISRFILKSDAIPKISQFLEEISNNLEKGYSIKIGVNSGISPPFKSRSAILNEVYKIGSKSLIKINEDYTYENDLAKEISVDSDVVYNITLDSNFKITAENIKTTIYRILSNKENIYYQRLQVVSDVKVVSEYEIQLVLKEKNPYFIYYLDFPVYMDDDILPNVRNIAFNLENEDGKIIFKNSGVKEYNNISSLSIKGYNKIDDMISDFKEERLDVITISSGSSEKLIGKYDYSMKKYRDGETLFLLGNKNSKVFKIKELRQALLYSLNREEIIKSQNNSYLELIDLPYIYSKIFYKYDITAANNVLLSNGWNKQNGVYQKDNIKAEFKLIVNSDDKNKCQIAWQIKQMAELNSIKINVVELNSEDMNYSINNGYYDIVLASVYIDETPDINYLRKHIEVSDAIKENIELVNNSDILSVAQNINLLQQTMSSEVACIGIYATNTAVIYQKYISGFDEISYLNVFKNLSKIGKLK